MEEEKNEMNQPEAEIEQAIEDPTATVIKEAEVINKDNLRSVGYKPTATTASEIEEEPAVESKDASKEIEKYFGNYPETLGMLSEDEGFRISDETAVFIAMTEGYARGSGIDNATLDKCLKELFAIGKAARSGGFTIDQLETIMKGLSHDSMLEKATREAEQRGRNAAIEEEKPDPDEPTSDGIPHLGAAQMRSPSTSRDSIFQLAQGAR